MCFLVEFLMELMEKVCFLTKMMELSVFFCGIFDGIDRKSVFFDEIDGIGCAFGWNFPSKSTLKQANSIKNAKLSVFLGPYKQASPRNRDFVQIPNKILKILTASISRFNFK